MACVYVVRAIDGSIKVGRTTSLRARLSQLRCIHGPIDLVATFPVADVDAARVEKNALGTLRFWRRRGEWFEPAPMCLRVIAAWKRAEEVFFPEWLLFSAPLRNISLQGL